MLLAFMKELFVRLEDELALDCVLTPTKEHGNERNGTRLFVVIQSVPT